MICICRKPSPYRRSCSLAHGFPLHLSGPGTLTGFWGQVAHQLGLDDAGMHRSDPNIAVLKTAIKFQCEQGISGLRPAVSLPLFIRGVLEIRVVEVDVTMSMGCRRQDDHTPIGGKLRYESVD